MAKLKLGSSGRSVKKLQAMLNEVGYQLAEDGKFGDALDGAVKDFQETHDLTPDGVVDRQTKVMLKRLRRKMRKEKSSPSDKRMHTELAPLLEPHIEDMEFDAELVLEPLSPQDTEPFANQHFKTLSEGRAFYQTLQGMDIPSKKKASVLAQFRKKVILDVYGLSPKESETQKIRQALDQNSWLLPEGRDIYFYYITDNPNFFKGGVKQGGTYYAYTVSNKGEGTYHLKIFAVRNNRSNLVYSSSITTRKGTGALEADIYKAENKGYRWLEHKGDYFKAILKNGQAHIEPSAVGGMSNYKQGSSSSHTAQEESGLTEKNLIRTALKCFISEYSGVLA